MMAPKVAEVFDVLKRFHVYDHGRDEWAASGVEMPDGTAAVQFEAGAEGVIETYKEPAEVAGNRNHFTIVWEDDANAEYDEANMALDAASDAADVLIRALAKDLDVDEDRVRIVSMRAPNQVSYFLTAPEGFDGR